MGGDPSPGRRPRGNLRGENGVVLKERRSAAGLSTARQGETTMAKAYRSMDAAWRMHRREFLHVLGTGTAVAGGLVLGVPTGAQEATPTPTPTPPPPVETNIAEFMKVPKGPHAIPGPFPGRVVQVTDKRSLDGDAVNGAVVAAMFAQGVTKLTGRSMKRSFKLLFSRDDVVGIKVNPVGAPHISTKPELVDAVVDWLIDNGLPKKNIVIWDRFAGMLPPAGYTADRFPGIAIEALQTMDEEGGAWRDASGKHVSIGSFDQDAYYFARGIVGKNVRGYKDDEFYENQHVFNGEYSYFGKLVTQRLTKIVNLAAYKNTGNGISMATKNLGYAAICNTGRLHAPLFFKVCTEVLAAPAVRDKLVLNVTDGLRAQYDGGPDVNEQFLYPNHSLYFATDPFALDMVCHRELVAKRKAMGVTVNEHPRFTEYLHYAEKLGLGVADPKRITHVLASA
jgi:hypothetical protein